MGGASGMGAVARCGCSLPLLCTTQTGVVPWLCPPEAAAFPRVPGLLHPGSACRGPRVRSSREASSGLSKAASQDALGTSPATPAAVWTADRRAPRASSSCSPSVRTSLLSWASLKALSVHVALHRELCCSLSTTNFRLSLWLLRVTYLVSRSGTRSKTTWRDPLAPVTGCGTEALDLSPGLTFLSGEPSSSPSPPFGGGPADLICGLFWTPCWGLWEPLSLLGTSVSCTGARGWLGTGALLCGLSWPFVHLYCLDSLPGHGRLGGPCPSCVCFPGARPTPQPSPSTDTATLKCSLKARAPPSPAFLSHLSCPNPLVLRAGVLLSRAVTQLPAGSSCRKAERQGR